MSNQKTRLELTWIGKDKLAKIEPRILLEEPERSYRAENKSSKNPIFDNRIIFGDNLLALKALEHQFIEKVKCIFIDPPYNTGSAFEYYDDGIEHSMWLSLMRDRLELLNKLLCVDGSIWITIDDNECHYLKVLCDEIFGRKNFVADIAWQKRTSPDIRATIGSGYDHILVYAKEINSFKKILKKIPKTETQIAQYKNPDNDSRGAWVSSDYTAQGYRPNQMYEIKTPSGAVYTPPTGTCWKNVESVFLKLVEEGRIWFGKNGSGMPRKKTYLSESEGQVTWSWWPNSEVGHNQEAKKEIKALFGSDDAFITPKPERLLERIMLLSTDHNDIVLDSFAGSGTTGAVAHKMGRRWIMVELGEHCHTHIIPRLQKVINGEDQGGISKSANWYGGGGFKYYRLAPSLLEKDKWDNWVINHNYNAPMLAEALCKLEGFTYTPSDSIYWQQGYSTENDYIYVTTAHLTNEQLQQLSDEVGTERTLLVLCTSFKANVDHYLNLTVKKIPQHVLSRCEWGHDDYSLHMENLPGAQLEQHQTHELNKEKIFNEPTC